MLFKASPSPSPIPDPDPAQYYDPDIRMEVDPAAGGAAATTPLPAGCVRIDSVLGEVPPDIFGRVFEVDIPAQTRGRRLGRGVSAAP